MEISFGHFTLFITILLFGLVAGLCFTWGNAVTPGIGQLGDMHYLQAFQKMNRSIKNPLFFLVFMGSFPLGLAAIFTNRGISSSSFWLIVIAVGIYGIGVVWITLLGNVPLNELLDKTDLMENSPEELKTLRERFEQPWNRFHTIRIFSASISFAMLVLSALYK